MKDYGYSLVEISLTESKFEGFLPDPSGPAKKKSFNVIMQPSRNLSVGLCKI